MRLRDLHILASGTAALGLSLAGLSVYVSSLPPRPIPEVNQGSWQPAEDTNAAIGLKPPQELQLAEALARPLFSPTRRPFDPSRAVQPAPQPPPPPPPPPPLPDISQVILRGLTLTPNVERALLASPEHPDGEWLGVGNVSGGWKVLEIDAAGVTLGFGTRKTEIKLYVEKPAKQLGQ